MKRNIIIIVLLFLSFFYISCSSDEDFSERDYWVDVNGVEFNFRVCTKYESELYNYDFYVIKTTIKSDNNPVDVLPHHITMRSSDIRLITNQELYFYGLNDVEEVETDILIQVKKGKSLYNEKFEIDFSIFSFGSLVEFNKILQKKSNLLFEEFHLENLGDVKKEHYGIFIDVCKNEKFDIISNCSYFYNDELKEDTYIFSIGTEKFSLSVDEKLKFNVMHFYQSSIYDVYVDSKRNSYYLTNNDIYVEFLKEKWQDQIEILVNVYYNDVKCSDFKCGRIKNTENGFVITFITEGKNIYGMTLYKEGILYLMYNHISKEYEISLLEIEDEILIDNRITISFDTGTIENVQSRKIMRFCTIEKPQLSYQKEGYKFVGWRVFGEEQLFDFSRKITNNIKLVAVWEKLPTYNCNLIIDESIMNIYDNVINVEYLSNYELPIPYKNLYEFQYWYIMKDDKEVILTNSNGRSLKAYYFNEDISVYPKFIYSPKGELSDLTYEYSEADDGYFITGFKGKGDIFFPSHYNDKPIIGIKRNSFNGYLPDAKKITSITFPEYIKYIEDDFIHYSQHVENMIYIYFKDPDSIIELGASNQIGAFNKVEIGVNCNKIGKLFVNNGNIVISDHNLYFIKEGESLFSKDKKILYYVLIDEEKYSIVDSVEYIADYSFVNCRNLKELHLSKNLKSISQYSFYINGGHIEDYYFYSNEKIEIIGKEQILSFSSNRSINFFVLNEGYQPFNITLDGIQINSYVKKD